MSNRTVLVKDVSIMEKNEQALLRRTDVLNGNNCSIVPLF